MNTPINKKNLKSTGNVLDFFFFQLGCLFNEKHLKIKLLHIDKTMMYGDLAMKEHIAKLKLNTINLS